VLTLRVLLGLAIAGQVGLAIQLWPLLPASIPIHFDITGGPDGWAARDYEWFVISGLIAAFGAVLGLVMPRWTLRMARNNSTWLNVPQRERFRKLPEEARVRAVSGLLHWLVVIAIELQVLMAFLLYGTFRVAIDDWHRLPPPVLYGMLGALLGTAIALAVDSSRSVKRELAASADAAGGQD